MPLYGWNDEEVYYVADRAHSLFLQGRYREAGAILEGLVIIDPASRYCANALAACWLKLGDPQRAVDCLDRLLARYPDDAEGRIRRCEAYLELRRIGDANNDLSYLRRVVSAGKASAETRAHTRRLELRIQAAHAGYLEAPAALPGR